LLFFVYDLILWHVGFQSNGFLFIFLVVVTVFSYHCKVTAVQALLNIRSKAASLPERGSNAPTREAGHAGIRA
jgi:hypothetical protein